MTTGEAVTESLIRHGVDTVFGIPGAHMYDLNDALERADAQIRFVTTRHEQGAGFMAFGYAKSTGRTGVYTVVPGPGALNTAAALCTGYGANAAMLCVTGNVMSHLIGQGRGQLHELPDQLATLQSLTAWAGRIDHPSEAPAKVAEAFRHMHLGRRRPAAVEAPWDVFGQSAPVDLEVDRTRGAPPSPDPRNIEAAASLIAAAENPLIVVGAGAMDAGAEIAKLAEAIKAPVTTHRSGKGVISDRHPLAMNSWAAYKYWPDCDLVIGIGSRLELAHFRWTWRPPGLKTIRIDIDPTEMVRLKPDVGIVADAAEGTGALLQALAKSLNESVDRASQCEKLRNVATRDLETLKPQYDYLRAIRAVLPDDGFYVEEVSQMGFAARLAFPVYQPRTYVTCGYQETLGFGFHTALGVKVANPERAVICVTGDGGFMFGVQELATAVQEKINVVTIVFNNSSYGNVRRDQMERYGGRLIGADLVNPDFVALAESFGAVGMRATDPAALAKALSAAIEKEAPVLIEVPLERGSETSPWPFTLPAPPSP